MAYLIFLKTLVFVFNALPFDQCQMLSDSTVLTQEELKEALLASNHEDLPFTITVNEKKKKVDLEAEWKIVDAKWSGFFHKAGVRKVFKIKMRFDEEHLDLRAKDELYEVKWRKGIVSEYKKSKLQGKIKYKTSSKKVAFNDDGEYGEIYKYKFNSEHIKEHIINIVEDAGWNYKALGFKKL